MDSFWFLQNTEFFSGLQVEKEEFLNLAIKKVFKKDEIIFTEEDQSTGCYYIEKGLIRIFNSTSFGKETIFFMHQSGNMFGLSEFASAKNRRSTAQALTKTETYFIAHDDFQKLLEKHFSLAKKTISVLGARVRKLSIDFSILASCSAMTRLMYILISLAYAKVDSLQELEQAVEIPYKLSQEQLAMMIASTQPTVSLLLTELIKEELILSTKQPIVILNPARLLKKYIDSVESMD